MRSLSCDISALWDMFAIVCLVRQMCGGCCFSDVCAVSLLSDLAGARSLLYTCLISIQYVVDCFRLRFVQQFDLTDCSCMAHVSPMRHI